MKKNQFPQILLVQVILVVNCSGIGRSNLHAMASSSSQQELIQKLKTRVKASKASANLSELQLEVQRCQAMPLTDLGKEVVIHGCHRHKTVHEVYRDQLDYVVWLMQNQKTNPKFVNIVEYTRRKEDWEPFYPVEESPQGYAAPKTKSKPADQSKSSETIPHPDEVESDWDEMTPDMNENAANSETQQMFKAMMGAFSELKLRMDELHRTSEVQQMNLHQGLGAINQIQVNQEQQDHRLRAIEQQIPKP